MCLMMRRAITVRQTLLAASEDAISLKERGFRMCLMMRRAISVRQALLAAS